MRDTALFCENRPDQRHGPSVIIAANSTPAWCSDRELTGAMLREVLAHWRLSDEAQRKLRIGQR